jgi:hypothetical protein
MEILYGRGDITKTAKTLPDQNSSAKPENENKAENILCPQKLQKKG